MNDQQLLQSMVSTLYATLDTARSPLPVRLEYDKKLYPNSDLQPVIFRHYAGWFVVRPDYHLSLSFGEATERLSQLILTNKEHFDELDRQVVEQTSLDEALARQVRRGTDEHFDKNHRLVSNLFKGVLGILLLVFAYQAVTDSLYVNLNNPFILLLLFSGGAAFMFLGALAIQDKPTTEKIRFVGLLWLLFGVLLTGHLWKGWGK